MNLLSTQNISDKNALHRVLLGFIIFFLGFGWLMILLSSAGLFYTSSIIISVIIALIFTSLFYKRLNAGIAGSKIFILVTTISFLISLSTCYFATPTIFGGRDQGAISTAAIYLAKNHQLKFSTSVSEDLFKKYGPGKALNYPGFDYTKDGKLISRFPVAYTSYLAAAYNLFGLKGIQYSNLPFLFLFFVIFWLILREFFSKWVSFLGFLLAASFFPFLWFTKYTLTETYALFLVWAGILSLIYYLKEKKDLFFYLALASFGLSALARIEGMIFFLLAIGYVYLLVYKKIILRPKYNKHLFIFVIFFVFLYIFFNFPALFDSLKNIAKTILLGSSNGSGSSVNLHSRLFTIFLNYNILVYIAGGFLAIIYFVVNFRKLFLKKEFVPLIILFPALVYLFFPLISLDDPWMLRRYIFAVFPLLIFYSLYALEKFFYHKSFLYLTLVILIVANCFISGIFLKTSENRGLLPQIKEISQNFGARDLILIDRLATGSGWSLMSEPLASIYGKQAVYFMNADDLKAIDQSRYENIYLVAPLANEKTWHSDITENIYKTVILNNNYLEPQEGTLKVAGDVKKTTFDGIWKIK